MKGLILGFQRLVWCPKWAPASNRSFTLISATILSSFGLPGTVWYRIPSAPLYPGTTPEHQSFVGACGIKTYEFIALFAKIGLPAIITAATIMQHEKIINYSGVISFL
jgi:hypothetical protein